MTGAGLTPPSDASGHLELQYRRLLRRYANPMPGAKEVHHCCIICSTEHSDSMLNRCPSCGGAMDAIYNLSHAILAPTVSPLERYFPLLPFVNRQSARWLGEGNTPCLHAQSLGQRLGLAHLYLKDETANPTRSTKDRIASVGLSRFSELGLRRLVIASTGNSSTAYARGVQLVDGFELAVVVGRAFLPRLNYADHPRVTTYVVDDDFVSAGRAAKEIAAATGAFFEGGFFSLSRREGLKVAYLEAFDAMPEAPRYVFQAVSSGMGLLGAYKGAVEYTVLGRLPALPRFIGVQQASCSPMASAYAEGASGMAPSHIVRNPVGIAEAILRGDPSQSYPYIRSICRSTGGSILAVDEAEIRAAHQLLLECEGLHACFASATALAGMIRMTQTGAILSDEPVLVNITGADRPFSPVPRHVIGYALRDGVHNSSGVTVRTLTA